MIPDHLTAVGAEVLAVRIREFWAALGFDVAVHVEYFGSDRAA
jgi:hypothetical protein